MNWWCIESFPSLSLSCVISLCDLMNRCVMFWISLYDVVIHVTVIPFLAACWGGPSAHCAHNCKTIFNLPVSLWWIDLWINQNAMVWAWLERWCSLLLGFSFFHEMSIITGWATGSKTSWYHCADCPLSDQNLIVKAAFEPEVIDSINRISASSITERAIPIYIGSTVTTWDKQTI